MLNKNWFKLIFNVLTTTQFQYKNKVSLLFQISVVTIQLMFLNGWVNSIVFFIIIVYKSQFCQPMLPMITENGFSSFMMAFRLN
jgi:hypothetical protein